MHTLSLFTHKGGVGKTTLTINLADAFASLGQRVLLIDADPQCNLSSFYLREDDLDEILGESVGGGEGGTIWTALKPVAEGRGDVAADKVVIIDISANISLVVGDVMLSTFEEELASAWVECFARKTRGYHVTGALARLVSEVSGDGSKFDIVMYDVGPNVGPLNRAAILSCDYLLTPVHTDLYSLRALTTVGLSLSRWVSDWKTIRDLASKQDKVDMLVGRPNYLGYIVTAFKAANGTKARAHADWERLIPSRIRSRVVQVLADVEPGLVRPGPQKIGEVKHFASLPAAAQAHGVPLSRLRGLVPSSQNFHIEAAEKQFRKIATDLLEKMNDGAK